MMRDDETEEICEILLGLPEDVTEDLELAEELVDDIRRGDLGEMAAALTHLDEAFRRILDARQSIKRYLVSEDQTADQMIQARTEDELADPSTPAPHASDGFTGATIRSETLRKATGVDDEDDDPGEPPRVCPYCAGAHTAPDCPCTPSDSDPLTGTTYGDLS